jgi:hypothetical protein
MPPPIKKPLPVSREPVSSKAAQAATKSLAAALEQPLPSSSTPVSDETVESANVAEEAKTKEVEMEGKPLPPAPLPVKDDMKWSPSAKIKKAIQLTRERMADIGHTGSLRRHRKK